MLTFIIISIISVIIISSLHTLVTGLGISSTISITYSGSNTNTICGILANNTSPQSIQCFNHGHIISLTPTNISFDSISGGRDFLCGLTAGGISLLCWNTAFNGSIVDTLYTNSTSPLTSLSVGEVQICALKARTGEVQCWNRNLNQPQVSHHHHSPNFPKREIKFEAITSGDGFSCGIVKVERYVTCWGQNGIGDFIEAEFGDMAMMTLVAGKSHVCGLSMTGVLVCRGSNETGQLNVPPGSAAGFRFSSVALGANHTCGVQRSNGSVVCWGGDGTGGVQGGGEEDVMALVVASFSFESLVAGLDFTCGLTKELSVICWGPGWPTKSSYSLSQIPLDKVIPGPCVGPDKDNELCGVCGSFHNSSSMCYGEMSICKSWCEVSAESFFPPPPTMMMIPSPSPQPSPSDQPPVHPLPPSNTIDKPSEAVESNPKFWGYEMFAATGILLGLLALLYLVQSQNKHNDNNKPTPSKTLTSNASLINQTAATADPNSPLPLSRPSTAPNSRSSSITFATNRSLSSSSSLYLPTRADKFTFESLALATHNFSGDNIIGNGSFGTVYRGRLTDGRPVAIKREVDTIRVRNNNNDNNNNNNAFDSELELLSRLHHKHLVGLVGYCHEGQERLLVYEYMSNGSLHEQLHTDKLNTNNNKIYSWKRRIKIALDAARGIDYLHSYAVPPIIHRDIKSSNILLDSNWIARVSDFGLSTLTGPPDDLLSSSVSVESAAMGTVGYIDPEYYVLKVLTTKSDVYGFGVVLLEILTGKKAIFRRSDGGEGSGTVAEGLVEYAGPYVSRGEVWKVLDRRVGYPRLNEAEAVELVAATALKCVSLEGKDRPTMSDVVTYLEKAYTM